MKNIPKLFWIPARLIRNFVSRMLLIENGVITYYNSSTERLEAFKIINKIKKDIGLAMDYDEMYALYSLTKRTTKIPGDIAEVGVYTAGSSKMISLMKGKRHLYLFDTFEGLPGGSVEKHFEKGDFCASLELVKKNMKGEENVSFHKGIFPQENSEVIKDKMFSFVNLDVDLYESTLDCLNFFYPRMSKGGILISHDYPNSVGVVQAFEEFFKDKIEIPIELTTEQVIVVKN